MQILAQTEKGQTIFQSVEQCADFFGASPALILRKIKSGNPFVWNRLLVTLDEITDNHAERTKADERTDFQKRVESLIMLSKGLTVYQVAKKLNSTNMQVRAALNHLPRVYEEKDRLYYAQS